MQTRQVEITTSPATFIKKDKYDRDIESFTSTDGDAIDLPLSELSRGEYYVCDALGIKKGFLPDGVGTFKLNDLDKNLSDNDINKYCYELNDFTKTISVDVGFLAEFDLWLGSVKPYMSENNRAFVKFCEILDANISNPEYIISRSATAIDIAMGEIVDNLIAEMNI